MNTTGPHPKNEERDNDPNIERERHENEEHRKREIEEALAEKERMKKYFIEHGED